jgi:hypothetical protein
MVSEAGSAGKWTCGAWTGEAGVDGTCNEAAFSGGRKRVCVRSGSALPRFRNSLPKNFFELSSWDDTVAVNDTVEVSARDVAGERLFIVEYIDTDRAEREQSTDGRGDPAAWPA